MTSQGIQAHRADTLTAEPQAAPGALGSPRTGPVYALVPALMSAALLWACYFPLACGWLAWVALVPLLALLRRRPGFRLHLVAFLGGLAFYLPALQWMRVADDRMVFTWVGLAVYCSLYFPVVLALVRVMERHTPLPLVLTLPVVWTALEMFRSTFGGGFSWYLLAHSQHDYAHLIQVADLTGAYGLSFLVAAVNALLFEVLYRRSAFRSWAVGPQAPPPARSAALLRQGAGLLAVLLAVFAYGHWRLGQDTMTPGPRLALVQGNLDQRIRNDVEQGSEVVRHYAFLSHLAATSRPDLIVWPETSYPGYWVETRPGVPAPASRELAREVARHWPTNVLIGLNAQVLDPREQYNSAVLIDPHGELAGRYDKMHRVPFGEYVPLRGLLPFMDRFAPYDFDYGVLPGRTHTRFTLEGANGQPSSFGVLICYEDTDPDVARPYVGGDGPPVDFLVNISNDGWFQGTSEHEQHLAVCRFRAVECRRSVARAVNMGVSAVIDSNGRVLTPRPVERPHRLAAVGLGDARQWEVPPEAVQEPGLPVARWAEFKKVPGVLLASVPLDNRESLYARWGDWLPWSCWALVLAVFVRTAIRMAISRRRVTP